MTEPSKKEIQKALDKSIAHWRSNTKAKQKEDIKLGRQHCALCSLFWSNDFSCCEGCPIREETGETFCENTPYKAVRDNVNEDNFEDAISATKRMYKFLQKTGRKER